MKDNWEKHKPELMLTEQDLTEIIHRFNPHLIIDSFQLLTGGLSHTNYKVVFNNQTPPLVVRLTENNENLEMEHALHRLLVHSTKIPVPNFIHITEWKNCSAGILEWKHGVLLKNRMFNGDRDENYALGLSAGSHLATFRNVTFDPQDSMNGMKNIESFQLTPDSFVEFVEYFVNGKAAQWLRKDLAAKLISFAISNASLFSEDDNKPALVHADYNGLNILVEQEKSVLSSTGNSHYPVRSTWILATCCVMIHCRITLLLKAGLSTASRKAASR